MSEGNGGDFGAFLAGFVIGGLAGAAAALILAPQSGQELRNVGGDRLRQVRNTADSFTQDYREKAGEALSSAQNLVQERGGQMQEQARIVLDSGRERVSSLRSQGEEATTESNGSEETAVND